MPLVILYSDIFTGIFWSQGIFSEFVSLHLYMGYLPLVITGWFPLGTITNKSIISAQEKQTHAFCSHLPQAKS